MDHHRDPRIIHELLLESGKRDQLRVETTEATIEGYVVRVESRSSSRGPTSRRIHLSRRIGPPFLLVLQCSPDRCGRVRAFRARRLVTGEGCWRGAGIVTRVEHIDR